MSLTPNDAAFIAAQTGKTVVVTGEPGTCKTATIEAFAEFLGLHYELVHGDQCDPSDISGYIMPATMKIDPALFKHKGAARFMSKSSDSPDMINVAEYGAPAWMIRCITAPTGSLLMLDELMSCSEAHQAAMLQILNTGLPNTIIMAAGNPADQAANGHELAPPTVNRMYVHEWKTSFDLWSEGMMTNFQDQQSFPRLPTDWRKHIPKARGMVIEYLRRNRDVVQKYPDSRTKAGRPWPSYRSWTNAITVLAGATSLGHEVIHGTTSICSELMAGCVGVNAAAGFLMWAANLDLPDPEDLLNDPKCFPKDATTDVVYAALYSVSSAVADNCTEVRVTQGWDVFRHIAKKNKEIVTTLAGPMVKSTIKMQRAGCTVTIPTELALDYIAVEEAISKAVKKGK